MNYMLIITLLLILLGMIVMFMSILKSFSASRNTEWFLLKTNDKIKTLYKVHQLLMIFFFFGYLFVFSFIILNITIINMFFVGLIFFFGAVFVFLGIFIYSYMLSVCKKQHVEVLDRNEELIRTENAVIFILAYMADLKDYKAERKNFEKFSSYARTLAKELQKKKEYSSIVTEEYITNLERATPLYNIGKLGISDVILENDEKLSPDEFEEIKKHCECGVNILTKAKEQLRVSSFFPIAIQIAYSHHERWDGKGYPRGLKKEEIPLSARIVAVINVYSKLVSNKYRFSMSETFQVINKGKGKQFDPDVVDAFIAVKDIFAKISDY